MSIQISGGGPGVADIQSGLATAAALATVDGIVDSILEDTGTTLPATLGTPVNTNGTATLAAMIGDPANSSLVARLTALATALAGREQAVGVNAPNHTAVTADMSSATWNTVATHEVFTVTGAVRMRIWVECTTDIVYASDIGTFRLYGGTTPLTDLYTEAAFMQGTGVGYSSYYEVGVTSTSLFDVMSIGKDVGYQLGAYAPADGTLIFHCVWEPLSVGATVVAGAGGPL